jgi:hypothetical protein
MLTLKQRKAMRLVGLRAARPKKPNFKQLVLGWLRSATSYTK